MRYQEYVYDMLRQYFARSQNISREDTLSSLVSIPNSVERINCACVASVLSKLSDQERNILRETFSFNHNYNLNQSVSFCAEAYHIPKQYVWNLIHTTVKEIARTRSLV